MTRIFPSSRCQGFSLLEVLITLLVVSIGLLGVSQLMVRIHVSEMEAYQRVQALVLLSNIVDRITINRETAACFALTTDTVNGTPYIGADGDDHLGTPACAASTTAYNTQAIATLNEIDDLLEGASETMDSASVGAMIGARSCISYDSSSEIVGGSGSTLPGTGEYTVVVVWQGLVETFPSPIHCADGLYGNENLRRVVSTTLRLAKLD